MEHSGGNDACSEKTAPHPEDFTSLLAWNLARFTGASVCLMLLPFCFAVLLKLYILAEKAKYSRVNIGSQEIGDGTSIYRCLFSLHLL